MSLKQILLQSISICCLNLLTLVRSRKELLQQILIPILSASILYFSIKTQILIELLLPIYLPLFVFGFTRRLLINFVNEKKEKKCEYLQILGLSHSSYLIGWLQCYYLLGSMACSIVSVGLLNATLKMDVYQTVIAQFLYTFASINQCFFISVFFDSPKLAGELGSLFQQLGCLVYFLLFLVKDRSKQLCYLVCIFPQTAISLSVMSSLDSEVDLPSLILGIKLNQTIVNLILLFDIFFYLLAYFYLQQVIPNQYGQKKSPCFIFYDCCQVLQNIYRSIGQRTFGLLDNDQSINQEMQIRESDLDHQDYSSAIYHEQIQSQSSNQEQQNKDIKKTVQFTNLYKKYKETVAVDSIDLSIYESQIFGLLGHNGAGKTTIINMLTGLISIDGGNIRVLEHDTQYDLHKVRQSYGICFQDDILYDELTVVEHLKLVLTIKSTQYDGLFFNRSNSYEHQIQTILTTCELQDHSQKQAKQLSGGNKRKLSLALAILNNNKIIILDEPTSGMDPNSRQAFWNIIRSLKKQNKTVILTTHYLDEADHLCDRIAIINKGKLLIIGTSDFIKKKFGVGYNIQIQNTSHSDFKQVQNQIVTFINDNLNGFEQDQQKQIVFGEHQLTILVPFKFQQYFETLFFYLHHEYNDLVLNMEMNTLEDAFINIGLEQHHLQNQYEQNSNEQNSNDQVSFNPMKDLNNDNGVVLIQYNRLSQICCIYMRKYYQCTRILNILATYFTPILFLLVGVLISQQISVNVTIPIHVKCLILGIFIVQAYAFNSSVYLHILVYEKEQNIRYLLKIMGMQETNYYLGNYLFDYSVYSFTISILFLLIGVLKVEFLYRFIILMIMILQSFGLSLLSYSYFFSLLFRKTNQAYKLFPLINYFLTFLLPTILIAVFHKYSGIKTIVYVVFSILSPFQNLNNAMQYMPSTITSEQDQFDQITLKFLDESRKYILIENSYHYCLIMLVQSVFYYLVLRIIEDNSYNSRSKNDSNQVDIYKNPHLMNQSITQNDDIEYETRRISESDNMDQIKTFNLQKTYQNGFQAIQNISFGVEHNQIFGLLGPNGAGKSSTFGILSGLIQKSKGDVFMFHRTLCLLDMDDGQTNTIGVSPQFLGLYEFMTVQEHIYFYCRLKGIHSKVRKQVVDYYLDILNLNQYRNVQSHKLSGGNRKKLSVMNALIGLNKLIFLDEPSNGLDALNKRNLQKYIQKYVTELKTSLILTTHSMQEAEYLCHKIGILINGRFMCMGSLQYLKNKYGDGYQILIRTMNQVQSQLICDQMCSQFKLHYQDKQQMIDNCHLVFRISQNDIIFYKVFQFINSKYINIHRIEHKQSISDYSIQQCSLDKIFIEFSKNQVHIPMCDN